MGKRNKNQHEDQGGVAVRQLATRIPTDLYKTLKLYAVTNDISIAELVSEAITELLKSRKAKKAA